MFFLNLICLLIGTGLSLSAHASENWPPIKLGVNVQSVSNSIEFQTLQKTGLLTIRPPNANYAGAILGYKWLSGTLSFAVPAKAEIRDSEGVGQYRDMRLSYYNDTIGLELSFNQYTRFILENSALLSSATLAGRTYYSLDEMKSLGFGLTLLYNFNAEKHTLAASLDQSDFQSQSAGGFVLISTIRSQSLSNSYPFIPAELQSGYGIDSTLRAIRSLNIAAGPGYSYFLPYKRIFVSFLLGVSFGNQNLSYATDTGDQSKNSGVANAHSRVSFGLNDPNYFAFLSAYFDRYQFKTDSLEVGSSIIGTGLSFGVRF